jgi:hypothetical protein
MIITYHNVGPQGRPRLAAVNKTTGGAQLAVLGAVVLGIGTSKIDFRTALSSESPEKIMNIYYETGGLVVVVFLGHSLP